jgi:outer membrane protein assembly factor BamE (lipoprotein component of BamABCDE complex)
MKSASMLLLFCFTLLAISAVTETPPATVSPNYGDVNMKMVAKIKVGVSSGAQVRELLGTPWRTTNYGDCHPANYQEIWEYVGQDDAGLFRIHIEFDDDNIARIVAKIPQKGSITVLAAAPRPAQPHRH